MNIIEAIQQTITDVKTWVNNNINSIRINRVYNEYTYYINTETSSNTLHFIRKDEEEISQLSLILNGESVFIKPKLKIENNKWYASYDNGTTWEFLYEIIPYITNI